MNSVKSITTVRAHGNGNNGNWVARMRFTDGTELFGGLSFGYDLQQAQRFAAVNRENTATNDPFTGVPSELPYQPLPAGVTISAK